MSLVKTGDIVNVHYRGTFDNGNEFDTSFNKPEPITVQVGAGQVIPGFDAALIGMAVGDTKVVHLTAGESYGEINPGARQTVPRSTFPEDFDFQPGVVVQGHDASGAEFMSRIESFDLHTVVLDFNHPLAGKNLNFELELVTILNQDE